MGMQATMQRKGRILVVEDQADLRKLVSLTLRTQGHELTEAASVDEALAALAAGVPDVVLLDVMLAGNGNGFDLCRQIKADERLRQAKVVVMTASDQAEQRRRAIEVGADHYVAKPFSPRHLRELVASLLGGAVAQDPGHG